MDNILRIGSNVNIKRTDGRVHAAIVAAVNHDMRSVTVEWFEQGETKGKEVDMSALEALNPEIIFSRPNGHNPIPRDSSGSSEEDISAQNAQGIGGGRFKLDESDEESNGNQFSPNTTTLSTASRQTLVNVSSTNGRPANGSIRSNAPQLAELVKEPIPQRGASLMASQNSRRSNVVKEVEKLRKNREERRRAQACEKAEKEAFLQMAPGNPYWELLHMIVDYRKGLDIKPLNESDEVEDHLITVCVRKRPLNKKEAAKKEVDVITIPSKNQLIVHEPKKKVDLTNYLENQIFRFDYAFDETCTNEIVYRYTAQPLIKTIFDGGFATCFAYGQTGSGKTHTMGGEFIGKTQDCQKGIYALAAADVFRFTVSPDYKHHEIIVAASFFEIYSGKVFDLLNNKSKLRILEDGKQQVCVVGLTEKVVSNKDEVLKLIKKGNQARTSGQTSANSNSSRSHAVFQIILRTKNSLHKIHGKFSLIDLAGNERGADTSSADRQTRMEGAEINKSLLALKECIRALGRKGAHLPFRVSKLTQVLRDSFVGPNSRTCMIAMVSPGVASCEHTLNTLRYADRVKELGAGDLITNPNEDFDKEEQDGDLLQLRSLNENDMTPEMFDFHQVISELQLAEDNMLENHRTTIDSVERVAKDMEKLLHTANGIQYDVEDYCKNLEVLLNSGIGTFKLCHDVLAKLKLAIEKEEQLSRKTKRM